METVLDTLIILMWVIFSLATFLGVIQELKKSPLRTPQEQLEDDDPVYLLDPKTQTLEPQVQM